MHRIAKLLARAGIASRREVERMIAEGRVARDGVAIDTPATLLASLHGVTVDGQPVAAAAPARLFLFHKPAGVLTTERDPRGRPTIYDKLPKDLPRLMPVGRLDYNTEGLLLMTNDGEWANRVMHPRRHVPKTYLAAVSGRVTRDHLDPLRHGVRLDDGLTLPARVDILWERPERGLTGLEMTLTEGRKRQVRRMLRAVGLHVRHLERVRVGPVTLDDLPPGRWRRLSRSEVDEMMREVHG